MRNRSPRSSSVRRLAAAVLSCAALLVTEAAAPTAHAIPRSTVAHHSADGSRYPGVTRRVVRPRYRIRPQRRFWADRRLPARANRSSTRIRLRVAPASRPLIPLTDEVWAKLRRCESGGRYDVNTGNGFYGAYQFVPRTWRGLGYSGMPHQTAPHLLDEAAQKLQARSGWWQWPACARRLGLR